MVSERLALSFLLATMTFCRNEPQGDAGSEQGSTEPAIVFLGDSLTAGFGLASESAFPAVIQKKIRAEGLAYRVINAGRSGDTTAGGLERLDWYLQPEVRARIFVIGLGSNDAIRGVALSSMEHNLREIIQRIHARDPSIKVLLFQMKTFPNMGRQYAGGYERAFARVARAEKITLLPFPLRGIAANPRLNQDDGVHPNEEGARILAETVWKDLRPHL